MFCPNCCNTIENKPNSVFACNQCDELFFIISSLDLQKVEVESLRWFSEISPEQQIKIIKPHYARWYKDQQIALEAARGDIE